MSLSKGCGYESNDFCHANTFRVDQWRPKLVSFFNTPLGTANILPSFQKNRELGLEKNTNVETRFMELKIDNARSEYSATYIGDEGWSESDLDARSLISDVNLVKGNSEVLYAAWHTYTDSAYANYIGDIRHFLSPPPLFYGIRPLGLKPAAFEILDICESFTPPKSVVVVGNCPTAGTGVMLIVTPEYEIFVIRRSCRQSQRAPIWSCASSEVARTYACGRENFITVIDMGSDKYLRLNIPGNVHSLQFDNTGQLLYAGTNNGNFTILDRRIPGIVSSDKYADQGIDETKFLGDEHTMIFSGMEGMLCKVDLRQNDIVTSYEGHVRNSTKRIPVSYSEEFNLLCASGSDSIVRFWALDDGKPIKQLQGHNPNIPSRAWLMSAENKCFLYVVEGAKVRVHKIACQC
ncbi:DDB1- and CUL4-associated factor 4-like protein 1, partial [Stegodyphus mimosarum]